LLAALLQLWKGLRFFPTVQLLIRSRGWIDELSQIPMSPGDRKQRKSSGWSGSRRFA